MKKIFATLTVLTAFCGSAFASADLSRCNGQYLLSGYPEAQAQINPLILKGIADGVLKLKTYNPNVGPFTVFGLEPAASQRANEAFSLMQSLQQVEGAIVECDSSLGIN